MNKLPLIEVLLLAFVSFDKPVSGIVITGMIKCPRSVAANTEIKLKCVISHRPTFAVIWVRPGSKVVAICDSVCTTNKTFAGKYSAEIVGRRRYTLIIHKFNLKTDVGTWYCADGPTGSHNSCDLKLGKDCTLQCKHGTRDDIHCVCHCENKWTGKLCETSLDNPKKTIDNTIGVYILVGVVIFMLLILILIVAYIIYRRWSNKKGDQQQMASLTGSGSANTSTNNTSTNNSKNMATTKEQSASLLVSDVYTAPH